MYTYTRCSVVALQPGTPRQEFLTTTNSNNNNSPPTVTTTTTNETNNSNNHNNDKMGDHATSMALDVMKRMNTSPRRAAPIVIPTIVSIWLRENFVLEKGAMIPKWQMYDEYEAFCRRSNIRPKSPNVFGKIVKQHFPSVGCSRIGSQRNQKAYYTGLGLNLDDSKKPTATPITTTTTTTTLMLVLPSPPSPPQQTQQQQPQQRQPQQIQPKTFTTRPTTATTATTSPTKAKKEDEERMLQKIKERFFAFTPSVFPAATSSPIVPAFLPPTLNLADTRTLPSFNRKCTIF